MTDILLFLRCWLRQPLRIAAVAPSSRALATLITCDIAAHGGPVLELGAGTGAFTRALLARGVPERQLALVESHPMLADLLRLRFPAAQVLAIDAAGLRHHRPFGPVRANAVVSGLPLLSMHPQDVAAILRGAFGLLRHGGAFYQFTYGPRCPVPKALLEKLGLRSARVGRAWANLPPAAVYRIERRIGPATAPAG